MRNLFLYAILLLFFLKINSQTPLQTKVDSMLVDIDQTDFTSAVLYDRTVPWASLHNFNELHNTSDKNHFRQALLELHNASLQELFIDPFQLEQLTTHHSVVSEVDLGILNVSFHKLNYNQEDENQGGLTIESLKFEKISNDKDAFLENHVFVFSPLKANAKGATIVYNINEAFIFQSTQNKNITDLAINFGNNQSHQVIENGVVILPQVTITYDTQGTKNLEAQATMADGTSITTLGSIYISGFATSPPISNFIENVEGFESSYPFTGYEPEDIPITGKLDYRIFFRSNAASATLTKPIIIIDGFDPGDKRKILDADTNQDPDKHRSINEMMEYIDDNGNPRKLIEELNTKGYDVVIVNHPIYTSRGIYWMIYNNNIISLCVEFFD